jgi:5-methylcytosine-specific restriction enzyme subunit McrC
MTKTDIDTVTEYQLIKGTEEGNSDATFRKMLIDFNREFKKTHKSTFLIQDDEGLKTQNFVGMIHVGNRQLEILPKIDNNDEKDVDLNTERTNLVRMLCIALDLDIKSDQITNTGSSSTILEVMIQLFCKMLWKELHRGPVRQYEPHSDNLSVMRGRLNIGRQIRENLIRPDRLVCDFDEFTIDTPINQILKATLRLLQNKSINSENKRKILQLLMCFDEVSDVIPTELHWNKLKIDRLSSRYNPLLELSKLFLKGKYQSIYAGTGIGFSLLFDMNELFEKYVGRMLKIHPENKHLTITLQKPERYLAIRQHDKTQVCKLKPDVYAINNSDKNDSKSPWIVDTKWKKLNEEKSKDGVGSGDVYQMLAYGYQYQTKNIFLIYPHHSDLEKFPPGIRETFVITHPIDDIKPISIHIATLELTDLGTVEDQLTKILNKNKLS